MRKTSLLTFGLTLSLLIVPVFAQGFDANQLYNSGVTSYLWTTVLGLPSDWLQPNAFLFDFALPFIALYAIIYGFLRQLQIYNQNIRILLAFVMAFMTLPSKIFITLVQWTLGLAGAFAYFAFLFIFFGSVYWISRGTVWTHEGKGRQAKAIAREVRGTERDFEDLRKEQRDLRNELVTLLRQKRELDTSLPDAEYERKFSDIEYNIDQVRNRLGELERQIENTRQKISSYKTDY